MQEGIHLDKKTHKYSYNGSSKNIISVTGFIDSLFPKYTLLGDLKKMKGEKDWNEKHPLWGKSDKYILWFKSKTNERKRILGVTMHELIENHLKTGYLMYAKPTEVLNSRHFNDFLKYFGDFIPYESEIPIFDPELMMAGTPDLLMVPKNNPNGKTRWLIDYKRIKSMKKYSMEKGLKDTPCESMDNCNYQHYSIQLNLYKYILEKNYGYTIIGMSLIQLHVQLKTFILEDVERNDNLIDQLRIFRLRQINLPK